MGMLITGHNKIRDFHSALITHLEVGTGTTQETMNDLDLETPIASSEKAIESSTTTSQQLVKEGFILSVDAVGESITEVGWKTGSPELMQSRVVHTVIAHTAEEDVIYETRWFYRSTK